MMNETKGIDSKEFEKILARMKEIQVSFLNVQSENGIIARPMMARFNDEDKTAIYFISGGEATQVEALSKDSKATVTMTDSSQKIYILVKGECTLTKSKEKIKPFWNAMTDVWFPEGLEHSDVTLIKLDIDTLECWDSSGNSVLKAIDMILAKINNRQPELGTKNTIQI